MAPPDTPAMNCNQAIAIVRLTAGLVPRWICQFVGREIRLLDYIEGIGQPLAYYAGELRRRGWKEAVICLPHDGVATNNITGKRYIDHSREAGFECETPKRTPGLVQPYAGRGRWQKLILEGPRRDPCAALIG